MSLVFRSSNSSGYFTPPSFCFCAFPLLEGIVSFLRLCNFKSLRRLHWLCVGLASKGRISVNFKIEKRNDRGLFMTIFHNVIKGENETSLKIACFRALIRSEVSQLLSKRAVRYTLFLSSPNFSKWVRHLDALLTYHRSKHFVFLMLHLLLLYFTRSSRWTY
jgi:hypothetical protein